MAAGDIARIIRAPGRIVIGPTTSFETTSFPYGGTQVGKSNLCVITPQGTPFRIESEALGEATDILEANKDYIFTCFLRGWDDAGVQKLLADGYEEGFVTQHATFFQPGNKVPGESTLDRAVVLVYVPDDTTNVPGVLIYRGIPVWTDGAELAFQRGDELGIPLTVQCLRDNSNNTLRIGRMPDLQLS